MVKVRIRITDHGFFGGFSAEIFRDEKWVRINKYIGGGLVSFDTREQAIKAAQRAARNYVREAA